MAQQKTQVIMYHHTHWDREWWSTYQQFRFRLVNVIDQLLENLDRDPSFRFTLDGQTIVLKDYLAVRPENRERLVGHIRSGRLAVGPWHILPDEFLVSAEAHIRNLWLGERTARELGVRTSRVGYLPDQFGHSAGMPVILAGFGIDSAVVWRGFGAPPVGHPAGDGYHGHPDVYRFARPYNAAQFPAAMQSEFWWEGPDGTRLLGIYLPLEYYRGHYRDDPDDPVRTRAEAVQRARRTVAHLKAFATTRFLLEPMGGDHLPSDARLPGLLEEINRELAAEGVEYRLGSLEEYVAAVRGEHPELQVVWRGEGRAFGRKAHLLPGVLSARLYLKRQNYECQTALERYAEPLQALNWLLGGRYEQTYLWTAWERLIENHPHDSICGCSIDQVHREMLTRFAESHQMARLLAQTALEDIARRVDRTGVPEGAQPLVVFNPLTWPRTDVVTVPFNPALAIDPRTWRLVDDAGREVPFQTRPGEAPIDKLERYDWLGAPPGPWVTGSANDCTLVTFVAEGVPELGYRRYHLEPRERPVPERVWLFTVAGDAARDKGDAATTGLVVGPGLLENQFLKVTVSPMDGSLTLYDKETGLRYEGLNWFEDGGDAGDTYNYARPVGDQVLSTRSVQPRLTWVECGPARATLRVTWAWSLPEGLTEDRTSRSPRYVPFVLHSDVTLLPGVKRVDIRTHFENSACDHRLRACFSLGAPVARSAAESHFCVVERPAARPEGERGSAEPAVDEHPQLAFVSVSDGTRGLTIANRGLPEYAADPDGTVRLTLLRAVGWLSRDDIGSRVGGAGPAMRTPDAQMLGPVEAEYALIPHAGDWDEAQSYKAAHDFAAPLTAVPVVPQVAPMRAHLPPVAESLPAAGALVEVAGDLLLTACKRAEDRDALLLRFVNESRSPGALWVRPARRPARAYLVNLREEPLEGAELPLDEDGAVALEAAPWQVLTLAFEF
ncbi:MAG: glycoside hydrolase family 38 C-terminal domain-containing protein [Symbiobacterium sp.]|uniref:alpha-mannosidase n=1 Tax=Symbiobacterium sp. TaxID=1971213 RepID=UPI003464037E